MIRIEIFFWLIFLRYKLRINGFQYFKSMINSDRMEFIDDFDERAKKITSSVNSFVNRFLRENVCMYKSGIAYKMLKRRHYYVQMQLGVRFPPFKSHAWLKIGNDHLIFGEEAHLYTVMAYDINCKR